MTKSNNILEMRKISKIFPGVRALDDVDFSVRAGEVHAIMGENGAGKSTLLKVLTGVYMPDQGDVTLAGTPFKPSSPKDAQEKGIGAIHQEVSLLPYLSVAENIFIGRQPRKLGRINWKSINKEASGILSTLGIEIDVTQPLGSFPVAIRQMVSIARAVSMSSKIIVMDEPTSSLDENEAAQLFSIIRKLKSQGTSIIFVTHFLDQAYEISDRITVLRNGRQVGVFETANLPKLELVGHMLGRSVDEVQVMFQAGQKAAETGGKVFFKAEGLGRQGSIKPFDLEIRSGEVLGLAGLLGSGRTEAARLLFGADKADSGSVFIDGKKIARLSPGIAIENRIGFSPEDRRTEAIIPDMSVRENIVLAIHKRISKFGLVSRKKQEEIAQKYVKALNIVTPSIEQPIKNLSGGNQQKVILARWLASNPRLLILDEPTRGIDVGAKSEIEELIEKLAQDGMSILFISSELEEVVRRCGRVAVLKDREKIAELEGGDIDEKNIVNTIAGGPADEK